jgi:hypothetical protein
MNPIKYRLVLMLIALATWGVSSVAHAEQDFPNQVQRELGLSYQIPCSVCHIKGNVAKSTPLTPFALSLRARGLMDSRSLTTSLAQLETDGVDSDGDGTPDVPELKAGTDPNSSANANIIADPEPGYGCGGSPPTGKNGAQALGSALALSWLFLRRRRGRP